MLTLYGTRGSGSAAVEAALAVAGLDAKLVDAASWQESPGLEALKEVNPLAQIPTLVLDDGSILSESAAILIHLGLVQPESGLLASDPATRAQQIRGLVYIAANCYAGIGILDYPERWYPDPDEAVRQAMQARGRARLHELWQIFADQFPARPWLSGERARRARHPRRDGLDVERRAQGARRSRAPSSRGCSRASSPIRALRRSGRATGRAHERDDALAARGGFVLSSSPLSLAAPAVARADGDELVGLINARRAEPRDAPASASRRQPLAPSEQLAQVEATTSAELGEALSASRLSRLERGDVDHLRAARALTTCCARSSSTIARACSTAAIPTSALRAAARPGASTSRGR